MRTALRLNVILLLTIVTAATILFVALGLVNQAAESKTAREQFETEKAFLTRQFANSLTLPLWNLDMDQVRLLARGFLEESSVVALSVGLDERNSQRLNFVRDEETVRESSVFFRGPPDSTVERPILKDSMVLGSVSVVFSNAAIQEALSRRVWYVIETAGLLNLLLVAVLTAAIRIIVLRPVRFLERYADAVSRGVELPQPKGVLFLGELLGLRTSITSMYNQLHDRYQALKTSEEELRSSRERFILAVEGADSGIWDWDIESGTVFYAPRWKSMLGYRDRDVPDTYDAWVNLLHPDDKHRCVTYMEAFLAHPTGIYESEYRLRQKDGTYRWVLSTGKAQVDRDGKVYRLTGSNTDIQARKEAERTIQEALREKTILLQEVHHRVKNNLQIVSSLLLLQAAHSKNEDTVAALETMRMRIHSMALLHETLYLNANLSQISFRGYMERLVQHLMNSIGPAASRISVEFDLPDVEFSLDTTVTLGLLTNEIITNAVKHAFPGERRGRIGIALSVADAGCVLTVEDDGVGLAESVNPDELASLGLKLIQMMAAKLQARVKCTGPGTRYEFQFVPPAPRKTDAELA